MKEIETRKCKIINEKTLLVTVDMGKAMHTGYCRCPDDTETKVFEFFNTGQGFHKFWGHITQVMRAKNLEEMVVGFESTGPYAEPLLHYLMKRRVKLVQVNPMHTKRLKEVQGNSPNKTDQKDPKVIADIIELGHALTVIIPEGATAELRRLTQARERAIQRRTAIFNQLHDLVFILFPEFLQVMNTVKTVSSQYLLKHYPTPQDIIHHGLDALTDTLRRTSRGKLDEERARSLYEAARESAGIKEGQTSILIEIREILAIIESSERFIAEIEKEMSCRLDEIPYKNSLLSLKGIGEITAAGLIGEVGDFTKFKTISEITKLAGLDLFEVSSGKHKGQRHISKRGRPLMRKLLFFAAINVVRKGGIMHEQYQKYINRGMPRMKALVAIARKLLCVIFALVRDHREYISNFRKGQNTVPVKEAA